MQEFEDTTAALRRSVSEMSRGLKLMTEAEWMGGFGVVSRDLETGQIWMSEGAYRILGVKRRSRYAGVELTRSVTHPDDLEATIAAIEGAIQGTPFDIIHRVIHPDGEVRQVHAKGKRVDAADGHPAILLGTLVDVTPDP